jgi:hypothetical protein
LFKSSLIAALIVAATAGQALSGVDFDHMPVGCSWATKYSNGNFWRETYKGRKGGVFVTETVDAKTGKFVNRKKFDAAGRMIERVWESKKWERFSPYSCFDVPGSCEYTFTNADGAKQSIVNSAKKSGKGYTVKARSKGGEKYPDERFELGPFGLIVSNRSSNYSTATGAFKGCGLDNS